MNDFSNNRKMENMNVNLVALEETNNVFNNNNSLSYGKQNILINSNIIDNLKLDVGKFLFKNMIFQIFPALLPSNIINIE